MVKLGRLVSRKSAMRSLNVFTLVLMLMMALPWAAFAANILSDAELGSAQNAPTEVKIGDNSFQIKVWAKGNVGAQETIAKAEIVTRYTMSAGGTIAPSATPGIQALDFKIGHNYESGCPTDQNGTSLKGCAADPFIINAVLTVPSGVAVNTSGTLQVDLREVNGSGVAVTPNSEDTGYVKVTKQATNLAVQPATATYGGSTSLSATLTSGTTALSGRTISFSLGGASVGTADTNASGVATLTDVSIGTRSAGTYSGAVTASFAEDTTYALSNGFNSLTVTKAPLSVTADNKSRAYGEANPAFTATYSGFVNSQTLTTSGVTGSPSLTTTATATSAVGPYPITAALGTLASGNYSFSFINGTLTVGKASQTITFGALANKTYGDAAFRVTATASSDLAVNFAVETGSNCTVTEGNLVTITGAGSCTIIASQAGNGNYAAATPVERTFTIARKSITGSFTASDKVYDGNTSATISARSLAGVVGSDDVSLSGGSATFATTNVGTGKTVTGTGFSLSGAQAGNYTLSSVSNTTANITAKELTGSFTAADKVYDGNTRATVADRSLVGVVGEDAVSLTGGSATFDTKHIGTGKTVTLTGATLVGTSAGNYSLGSVNTAKANITAKGVTGNFTAANKVYNGNADATITGSTLVTSDIANGDTVTLNASDAIASFSNANVGADKTVTSSGFSLSGADAGNYTLSMNTTTADITARSITVTADARSKTYGDDDPALTYKVTSGTLVAGDSFSGSLTRALGQSVGSYAINQGTLALSSNYDLTYVGANLTISMKALTGSFTADNKIYDGTRTATVASTSLPGVVGDDKVSLQVSNALFDNKNVGTNKDVTGSLSLTGDDAGNYSLTSVSTAKADITAKSITGSFTTSDKVYDGNTSAAVTDRSLNGTIEGDTVSLSGGTASFADKNVGTGKTVALTGATLAGDDSGNYTLGSVSTAKADITAKGVRGSFTAADKVYDGNVAATVTGSSLAGVVAGDVVSLGGGTATFDSRNVGTGKTVTSAGFVLIGDDSHNYALSMNEAKADITAKSITGSFTAADKVYDGNAAATISSSALVTGGVASGDDVTLNASSATASFSNANVGTGKTVTSSGFSLSGADAGNYTLTMNTTTANITARPITVTADAKSKVYGAADPVLTYSVTSGSLVTGDSFTGNLTRVAGELVGQYDINRGMLSAGGNYNLTYVGAKLTILSPYRWDGFLQPINDTAHQQNTTPDYSIFKAGSTIPVKFQLKDVNGNVVQAPSAPQWIGYTKGTSVTLAVDEPVYSLTPTAGTAYSWDGQQYQYNWSTKGLQAGFFYKIGFKLADGTTQTVIIGLR